MKIGNLGAVMQAVCRKITRHLRAATCRRPTGASAYHI